MTTTIKDINIVGGFQHDREEGKRLSIQVSDPKSGLPIVRLELDETQILNLLSGLHDTYTGGSAEILEQTIPRIGFQHVMVDVAIELEFTTAKEANLNKGLQEAWKKANANGWVKPGPQSWNSHNYRNGIYHSGLHGYFPWDVSLEEIEANFAETPPYPTWVTLSNLRTTKDRK